MFKWYFIDELALSFLAEEHKVPLLCAQKNDHLLCVCCDFRHLKDVILLTAIVQVLSTISSYFWYLWLLVRACAEHVLLFSLLLYFCDSCLIIWSRPLCVCVRPRPEHCTCCGWTSWAPGLWQKVRQHQRKWMRRSRGDKNADRWRDSDAAEQTEQYFFIHRI